MDKYFKAVGFGNIKSQEQFNDVVMSAYEKCEKRTIRSSSDGETYLECFRSAGDGFGLILSGEIDENEHVSITKCYPFIEPKQTISIIQTELEPTVQGNMVLYFYEKKSMNSFTCRLQKKTEMDKPAQKLSMGLLAAKAKVLLPVYQPQESCVRRKEIEKEHRKLLNKVHKGDEEAERELNDSFNKTTEIISQRLHNEDFFSIIEGYSEPIGDNAYSYSFLGHIEKAKKIQNYITEQWIYNLIVNITGTKTNVFISVDDLIGEPFVGMRLWGHGIIQGDIVEDRTV